MSAARNAVVALSVRSLRACAAGPLDGVTPLGKGTPLPARRALPANQQRTLKAYEFIKQPTSATYIIFCATSAEADSLQYRQVIKMAATPRPSTNPAQIKFGGAL